MAVANAKELFNQQVPAGLAKNPEGAKALGVVYLFKITGDEDNGGVWTVDLKSEPASCIEGEHGTPNCTLEIKHSDFMELLADPVKNGMAFFFSGKLKVGGDPMLATKLQKLFSM